MDPSAWEGDRLMREFLGRRQSGLIAIMLAITVRQRLEHDPDISAWRAKPPMPDTHASDAEPERGLARGERVIHAQ